MTSPIKIDIWSDIACPWCFIGKRRFEAGAAEAGVPVEIEYHSFELAPDTPVDFDGSEIDFGVTRPVLAHAPDSIEAALLDRGVGAAVIDLRGLSRDDVFRSRLLDLSFSAEAPYGPGYDAAIYLRDGDGLA